ncbi:hypothetical protein PINS_up011914 [Pythium insidiosum]|nr:hypothetical protein PINS_up011914 [Pythium insidiosum]
MVPRARHQALLHSMVQSPPPVVGDGITPSEELELILDARAKSRAGSAFAEQHVIHSEWLEQWLHYVHQDMTEADGEASTNGGMYTARFTYVPSEDASQRTHSGRPGPISNYALLDFVSGKLVPKNKLQRSRGAGIDGDFHVVSRDVWLVFLRLYGGGPSIQIQGEMSPTSNSVSVVPNADMTMRGYVDTAWKPAPEQWLITELDNNIPSDQLITLDIARTKSMSMVKPTPVGYRLDHTTRSATSTFIQDCEEGSARATFSKSMPPPREKPPRSHFSSGFASYFKKRRASDEQFSTGTSTISQISEGVVLFDPTQLETNGRHSRVVYDDKDTFSSRRSADPRETIAAVAAFASAAAEARRKSANSLHRHSTKRAVDSLHFHAISST